MGLDGNSALKIEGGGGQLFYLYTKDREFPSNFDVVPKSHDVDLHLKIIFLTCSLVRGIKFDICLFAAGWGRDGG